MTQTEKNKKKVVVGVAIILPVLSFIWLVILMPRFANFMQKDSCLDEGGSYNEQTKTCEKGHSETSSGLQKDSEGSLEGQKFLQQITYSNLVDSASQEELKMALQKAGIDEKNIEKFFESVDNYNKTIENTTLNSAFSTSGNINPKYDEVEIMKKWESKNPDFIGHNCRITSYNLMRDFIKIANPDKKDDSELFMDKNALEFDAHNLFSQEEKNIFESFYSKVSTTLTKDIALHLEKVKNAWKEKGVEFVHKNDKTKASLISVWFHSYFSEEENFLFIGHIGVLLPKEDGSLLFVEKISFSEPYQVLKFKNRTELNDYLMNKYDTEYGQPTASPFILENDELLETYRPNSHKKSN